VLVEQDSRVLRLAVQDLGQAIDTIRRAHFGEGSLQLAVASFCLSEEPTG
jgi:hypothetical protein